MTRNEAKHQIQCIYGLWQLRRLVGRYSYQIKTFSDTEEAMNYAKQHKVRVIREGII